MPDIESYIETLSREQLQALQLKVQTVLNELWGKNAFYTDKLRKAGAEPNDIRSVDDLARLLTIVSQDNP